MRGVLLYNHLLKQRKLTKKYQAIREGEKIKFAYLKEPNPLNTSILFLVIRKSIPPVV